MNGDVDDGDSNYDGEDVCGDCDDDEEDDDDGD